MITLDQAISVRNKFKELFWRKSKEKFNAVLINQHVTLNIIENDEDAEEELIEGDFYLKVFLFDLKDAEGLPRDIDGVEIVYTLTYPKKDSNAENI